MGRSEPNWSQRFLDESAGKSGVVLLMVLQAYPGFYHGSLLRVSLKAGLLVLERPLLLLAFYVSCGSCQNRFRFKPVSSGPREDSGQL